MNATTLAARAVLVDIEGTTSTIAFVHEVLFPYADEHLDAYVAAHRREPAVAEALVEAAREAGEEPDADDATVLAHLHRWIAEDRKSTPLKTLQGLIWAEGYAATGLRGHVYPDAAAGLRRWHDAGLRALRLLVGLGRRPAGALRQQPARRPDPALFGLLRHDDRAQARSAPRTPRSPARSASRRPRSCSSPTSTPSSTPPARRACRRCACCARPTRRPSATTSHPSAVSFDEIAVTLP